MRILVTGAGGFVGGHLLSVLHRAGHEVIGTSLRPWTPPVPVETVVLDIGDAAQVRQLLETCRPEGVIHLAAQASVRRSWEASDETFAVNVGGASHVFEGLEALPETRVLLVGSAQEYGGGGPDGGRGRPLLETDPLQPNSPYGVSKVAQELVGALYRRHFGMQVVTARPFNHTGPGQSPEYAVGAFCQQVAEIERGERAPQLKVGWLGSRRDYLDVRDVANAYRLLIEAGEAGEVYNVASGEGQRIGDLLDILLDAAGLTGAVEVVAEPSPRPGDPEVLVGDASKLREGLGWKPEIPLVTSLVDTLDSYRARCAPGDTGQSQSDGRSGG